MPSSLLRYQPDYATHPGEVLEEHLAVAGMTKAEFAARCGRPTKTISEIIHGKAAITAETALQFERVLGRPASLWQNLEATYRLRLAERGETTALAAHANWAKRFPVKSLVQAGAIEEPKDDADLVKKLLRFFGVGSIAGWKASFGEMQVAYRRSPSFSAAPESVTAWMRRGELEAAAIDCRPFDAKRLRAALGEARILCAGSATDVHVELVRLCADSGVALTFIPELPKTHLSGAARWLTKDKALIQLSLRHKTADHMWFSFFHEAGHILLHGKKTIFIDEKGADHRPLEEEANRFAGDILLPPGAYRAFVAAGDFSEKAVLRFARQQGTAAGIVVGRLQYEKRISYAELNGLKERLAWSDG